MEGFGQGSEEVVPKHGGLEKSEGETSPMECGAEYHQWPHLGIKPNVYSDEWI